MSARDKGAQRYVCLCIYRKRNAVIVRQLLANLQADERDWSVRLWALDDVSDSLAQWTLGFGPGGKFDLCNQLLKQGGAGDFTVVADDDVLVADVGGLVEYMQDHEIGLAQPAHTWRGSNSTYRFCRRRPWLRGRVTNMVEIGPLFAVGPRARDHLLPFQSSLGMGWGLEFHWHQQAAQHGFRIGIVDGVTMQHLGKLGQDYDIAKEGRALRTWLDRVGVDSVEAFQKTKCRHYVWQRQAPWLDTTSAPRRK